MAQGGASQRVRASRGGWGKAHDDFGTACLGSLRFDARLRCFALAGAARRCDLEIDGRARGQLKMGQYVELFLQEGWDTLDDVLNMTQVRF